MKKMIRQNGIYHGRNRKMLQYTKRIPFFSLDNSGVENPDLTKGISDRHWVFVIHAVLVKASWANPKPQY